MRDGVNYYVPASVLGLALLVKLPTLLRGWRDPTVRAVNALLALPCAAFLLAAPPTITAVNRITGVSNLSALLVHCVMTAYACASLILLDLWRADAGDPARTRRRVRRWKVGCGVVIAALVGLFSQGDVPVERPWDFDTYYATTPFIGEMVVLYLCAYVMAGVATTALCWNWMLDIGRKAAAIPGPRTAADQSLRVGLLVLVLGAMGNVIFGLFKLTSIVARWTGRNWDALNEGLPQFISASGMMIGVGLLVPAYGPGLIDRVWRPLRALTALRPLWRLVRGSGLNSGRRMFLPPSWGAGPEQVLLYRMTTIHDWMLELGGHCSDAVRERAHRESRARGAGECEAVAAGLAAMFAAAVEARGREAPSSAGAGDLATEAVRAAEAVDRDLLVSISRALPVVPGRRPWWRAWA
ncbi:MAB_1171c family putative transporter [Streptomyces sp. NPDC048606]|uniref:MAB_1171c family putative transporter n=1 Tax=Streptomyces sp. NPDC048606 TaxID=3154726 RepID=UPI0034359B36